MWDCTNPSGVVLISDLLREGLDADCSVLMGANVANEMASDAFCETTIGYKVRWPSQLPPGVVLLCSMPGIGLLPAS